MTIRKLIIVIALALGALGAGSAHANPEYCYYVDTPQVGHLRSIVLTDCIPLP